MAEGRREMQRCDSCGTENADDAVQCAMCGQPLHALAPVQGPSAGAAAYPGAPESSYYGARGYQLGSQMEQQRVAPRLSPGATIGRDRYRILRVVALGGMGAVYQAEDQNLHRMCAVKEMLDSFSDPKDRQQVVEWFKSEAGMLHDLNHPAIPRVRDYFEEDGRYYLVMDFVEGRNLAEVLDQEGVQSEERVRRWAIQLCDVLSYLHHQNVIFRDLKPANVMIGSDERVKLVDFGIARSLRAQNEALVIVTYGFAAPEQLQGMPEPRSDIFSLGSTMHRLLTLHDANNNKPMIFNFPPVRALRPDVTPGFEFIIMRALAPRPADRWNTAGEMGRAIRALPALPPSNGVMGYNGQPAGGAISRPLLPYDALIAQARDHLENQRWNEALKTARKAVESNPQNAAGHKILGQAYARSRPPDPQRALAAYQESLRLNTNDAETYRLIGDVYLFLLQRPQDAIPEYRRALQVNNMDSETHRFLGMCLEQTNQLEYARREFAESVRMAPHYVPAHMSYGQLCFRLNLLGEAERAFVEALRLNPGMPVARHLLAQIYERQGRIDEALREAEYAVQVDPHDQPAQATLARLRKSARAHKRSSTRTLQS
jgi:serine/threonine protein kinase